MAPDGHPSAEGNAVEARLPVLDLLARPLRGDREHQVLCAGELLDLPGSPIFALADALNLTFVPCSEQGPACNPASNAAAFVQNEAGRSRYDLTAPYGWLTQIFARTRHAALVHDSLAALLAPVEPASIAWLPASERGGAYRVDPGDYHPLDSEIGDLPEVLGALAGDWDRYFIPYNPGVPDGFAGFAASSLGVQFDNPYYGRLFLENAAHAETLITSSPRDIAIYSPAIPTALATHDQLVTDVVVDPDAPAVERPGQFEVIYVDAPLAGVDHPPPRVVRFPTYEGAGHAVTLDASAQLLHDVEAWLGPPVGP